MRLIREQIENKMLKTACLSTVLLLGLCEAEPRRKHFAADDLDPGELSFVVRVEYFDPNVLQKQVPCCTGSLIKPEWVLIAAHCDACFTHSNISVRYGSVKAPWNKSNTFAAVKRMVKHPSYHANPPENHEEPLTDEMARHFIYQNDIAVLEVDAIPLAPGKISSVEYTTVIGKEAVIAGYGIMDLNATVSLAQPLQMADVMIKECDAIFTRNSFPILCIARRCSEKSQGERVIKCDSGGPVMFNGRILGVCSYGFSKLHTMALKETGIYTAVSPYLDWIKSVTEESRPARKGGKWN